MGKFGKIIVTANLVTDPDESETHSYHDSAVVCQDNRQQQWQAKFSSSMKTLSGNLRGMEMG